MTDNSEIRVARKPPKKHAARRLLTLLRDAVVRPITIMVIMVVALYALLEAFRIPANTSDFDYTVFYFIAAVSFLSALFMIVRTTWDGWTVLGSGLLSHFLAVGMIYFLSAYYATHGIEWYTDEILLMSRSVLIVSGVFVLLGVIKEWTDQPRNGLREWFRRTIGKN